MGVAGAESTLAKARRRVRGMERSSRCAASSRIINGAHHEAAFKDVLGEGRVHERPMSMGGEDFSQFTRAGLRTFYWHLGTAEEAAFAESMKPGGKALANTHSAYYAPVPQPTLRTGVLSMSMAVLELMNEKSR